MSNSPEAMESEKVENTLLTALNKFGEQLQLLTKDLEAIEVITAIGNTTIEISSPKLSSEDNTTEDKSDITALANGKLQKFSGEITILARTRFELDGDLLVILPTKQKLISASREARNLELKVKEDNTTENPAGEPSTPAQSPPSIPPEPTTPPDVPDSVEIDQEILTLHKENVAMAINNLQFIYGKVLDIAKNFVAGDAKTGFLDLFKLK